MLPDLQDVPEEALDASSKESPISHALARTRRGWKWRRSRFAVFWGLGFAATGAALYFFLPRVNVSGSMRYAMVAVLCGTGVVCWAIYVLGKFYGLMVLFDLSDNCVVVFRGRRAVEQYPLHELAAIQTCYRYEGGSGPNSVEAKARRGRIYRRMEASVVGRFHEGKPLQEDNFQVLLVRRKRSGAFERRLIVSTWTPGQARKLAKRTAEALGVAFLDCAAPDDVKSVRASFLKSGGSLPRPQNSE